MTKDEKHLTECILERLETPDKPLTAWEEGFVDSVRDQFSERGDLSERQFEILERIYTEKTS